MSFSQIHGQLSTTVILYTVIVGIWGIFEFARKNGVSGSYWGALVIAELLILIQGLLGGYLWFEGLRPGRGIHVLYGAVTALGIPAIYVFTRGREGRAENLAYGSATLIVALLAFRAVVTA
jgi:hypothetical protein